MREEWTRCPLSAPRRSGISCEFWLRCSVSWFLTVARPICRTFGFLIKRKVLSPELCAKARDRMWAGNTSSVLRREDPATWVGPLPEADRTSTLDGLNDRTSQWRLRELSGEEDLLQLLPGRVFPWLEQLLGKGQVVEPVPTSTAADPDPRGTRLRGWPVWGGKELRGAYCNLPSERPPAAPPLATAARAGRSRVSTASRRGTATRSAL